MAGRTGRPPGDDDDERRLFEEEMRGVRPLRPGPTRVLGPAPRPPRPKLPPPAARAPIEAPAPLEGHDPSLPRDRLRALRRGELRPEATLDLHGRGAGEAAAALAAFVRGAQAGGRRCVLIVHGQGQRSGPDGPVLRPLVASALARGPLAPLVLAYVTAPRALGGAGATLVLLRRAGL